MKCTGFMRYTCCHELRQQRSIFNPDKTNFDWREGKSEEIGIRICWSMVDLYEMSNLPSCADAISVNGDFERYTI